jgi:UDP-N-acetylglucosamine 2-epimerase (non-hydrolysing)
LLLFNINPDYDLNLMKYKQSLSELTSSLIVRISEILDKENPDLVLVHGDTTTTMAASLAAFYAKIKVGHIEAGLRTNNIYSPFPEEVNRQIIGRIASYHFAPTKSASNNLISENISKKNIFIVGNTVIDSLLFAVKRVKSKSFSREFFKQLPFLLNRNLDRIILVTGHRRENFGNGFENICQALHDLAAMHPNVQIVYPVHYNPNVSLLVDEKLSNIENIHLIKPLDYLSFVKLMSLSYLVMTDSGGIQEEAPSLGKPVLLMRDTTERPEAVEAGTVKLVGTDKSNIVKVVNELLTDNKTYTNMAKAHNPYGDGKSSINIRNIMEKLKI